MGRLLKNIITLLSTIKNLIYLFYKDHDTIVWPDDVKTILNLQELHITETPELDLESFKVALKSFEDALLVKNVPFVEGKKNKIGYLLEKPLQLYPQNVEINGELAFLISKTINDVRDKDDPISTNPLCITSADIEDLLVLTSNLIKNHQNLNQNKPDLEEEEE
jgi:hypothetical protein